MFRTLRNLLPSQSALLSGSGQVKAFDPAQLESLNTDPYLFIFRAELNLISVFDDLKYDRSDLDALSAPMRRRVLDRLAPFGFRQVSGGVFAHDGSDLHMHIPKYRALGASPFDATRDTPRRDQDFYILTPTQTACHIIDTKTPDEARALIKALIAKHPVNLMRIFDYLGDSDQHRAFADLVGHLKFLQREAVSAEPLRSRRALR